MNTTTKTVPINNPGEVRARCPNCISASDHDMNNERNCIVHGITNQNWDYNDNKGHYVNGGIIHSLLECKGCQTVFYERRNWDSESIDHYYDAMGKEQIRADETIYVFPEQVIDSCPEWVLSLLAVDYQLYNILIEMYRAYDNGSCILASIGLRTALDRATELLKIDPAIPFAEKLNELVTTGWIGESEKDMIGVLVDAGSAAAHRGWSPDKAEVRQLIDIIELFIQRSIVIEKKPLALKQKIPTKTKRKKKKATNKPPSSFP